MGNFELLLAAPVFNVQLLLNGISVGAVFALAAYGLALVWGVSSIKNLAQGDFVMLGGYLGYTLSSGAHVLVFLGITQVVGNIRHLTPRFRSLAGSPHSSFAPIFRRRT